MPQERFLIDTHCWLWWHSDPDKLGHSAFSLIENGESAIFFSAVSAWEIIIKYGLGKLALPHPPSKYIPTRLERSCMDVLPIHLEHTLRVEALAAHHKDPFDRLLVAQAFAEDLTVITADPEFKKYGVKVLHLK